MNDTGRQILDAKSLLLSSTMNILIQNPESRIQYLSSRHD
jgi:hypothetical protein